MLKGFIVIFSTLAVMLIVAVGVIADLALVRQSTQVWQEHLREQNAQLVTKEVPKRDELVGVKQTALRDLIECNIIQRDTYSDTDRLPGIKRIEVVTECFEATPPCKNMEES